MQYTEFVQKYKTAKDKGAFIKKHITKQYLGYANKEALAKSVAKTTSWKTVDGKEAYQRDTCTQQFLLQMHLISNYTDVEFDYVEAVKAYDALAEAGALSALLEAVPESERTQLMAMTDMCASDIYTNFRDIPAYLDTKLEALQLTFDTIARGLSQTIENNPAEVAKILQFNKEEKP